MTEETIDLTGVDLRKLIQTAYALSRPQGLGYLHYEEGPLTEAEIDEILGRARIHPVSMDYVKGRAVKLTVFRDATTGHLSCRNPWFDHSPEQLKILIERCKPETTGGEA